jgi:hypothetical protein
LSWYLTGLFKSGIPLKCLGPTQRFLRMLVVAFCTFLWPSYQVSGRTWCKHIAPSTHLFHNTMEGSTCSWLSQAATRSSGMWRQKMSSILHGCHFGTISSFCIKNFVPDIFDQTSYMQSQGSWVSFVTDYGPDDWGSIPDREFFFQSLHPDWLWGPPSLLFNGYWGSFPQG